MDEPYGEEQSPLPIDFNGSLDPSQLPNVTLGNHSIMASHGETHGPMNTGSNLNGADRRSPVKTIKEYNQQVSDLTKENFNLKLRIYYLEQRMGQQYGDEQDVFKTNIELKVLVENLRDELSEKQVYLHKAAQAVNTLTLNHQKAEEAIRKECMGERQQRFDEMKVELDKAIQDCDRSQRQAEEAAKDVKKMEDSLNMAHKTNMELSEKLKGGQSHIDSLETKLKDSDALMQELKDEMSGLQKQLERKDRDMTRLSVCFQDRSQLESISILEPQHLQDKYDDQVEKVEKLKQKIGDLEAEMVSKDKKMEGMRKELDDKVKEVDDKTLALAKFQNTTSVMMNRMRDLNKNNEEKDKAFKALEAEVNELRQSLDNATKEKSQILSDSMALQETNDHLLHRVDEYRDMAEGVMQSLGRKEVELSGFQDQLKKAMEALILSETAVEELQMQLKKERAEFEDRLRNQARLFDDAKGHDPSDEMASLNRQVGQLKKTMADQNVVILGRQRDLTDLERQNKKLKDKESDLLDERASYERKISILEREIHTLRLELERKDMRIGNLQHNSVHIEAPSQARNTFDVNVHLLPLFNHDGHHHTMSAPSQSNNLDQTDGLAPPSSPTAHAHTLFDVSLPGNDDDGIPTKLTGHNLHVSDLDYTRHSNVSGMGRLSQTYSSRPVGDQANILVDQSLTNDSSLDHSLTDDAKEGHLRHSDSLDYNAFFEPRMQDRASLYRLDSKEEHNPRHHSFSPNGRSNKSRGQSIIVNGTSPPPPSSDLIDLFSGQPQSQRKGIPGSENVAEKGNSCGNITGRESIDSNVSFRNITLRSDRFSNVSVRGNRGSSMNSSSTDTGKNESLLVETNGRLSKQSDKNKSWTTNSADAGSTHDPDVVQSAIGSRAKEDLLGETVECDKESSYDKERNNSHRQTDCYQGIQTTPNRDDRNQDQSSRVSTFLTPNKDPPKMTDKRQVVMDGRTSSSGQYDLDLMSRLQDELREAVQQKEDAYSQIQDLQDKLEATENTVRQQSRKMKGYQSSLEQMGGNLPLKPRSGSSSSEASSGQKADHEESCTRSVDGASMEKGRDANMNGPVSLNGMSLGSPTNLIMMSPTDSTRSGKRINSPTSTIRSEGTCLSSPERMSHMNSGPQLLSSVSPPSFLQELSLVQNMSLNNTSHYNQFQPLPTGETTLGNFSTHDMTTSVGWNDKNEENEKEDPTLTSLLVTDYTYLNRRLTLLSKSVMNNTTLTGDQSFNDATLSVDKLQTRLAHLERIILMQKEEIIVYESLLTSMGVPVLISSTDHKTKDSNPTEDTKESLLRQHLVEIRKLRQRLENLDLTNDPDQLLIFHTHTQQRITQQEQTISKLQQKLVEKEDTWNRESMEMEHRMKREKSLLTQKLDSTNEEVNNQHITIEELENSIQNLKENLKLKFEVEEENEKLKQEKAEIAEVLVNREKEYLDMEKTMFKLELAKEEVESQKAIIKGELEENEKQIMKLKCDVDHYKESCRSLRDALRIKEDSLHEQVQCLKKMAQEKTAVDENVARLQIELENAKADVEKTRLEAEEMKSLKTDHEIVKEEFMQLRLVLDQQISLHKQIVIQKDDLEMEISRLSNEKFKVKADSEKRIEDIREDSKLELKRVHQNLSEEVSNLRSTLDKRRNLESELRMRVGTLEASLRKDEIERAKIEDELREKTEKVKKRDGQCQFVLDRFGKLEAAYKKQSQLLKDKNEAINSMKKQTQLYESTLSSLSNENQQGALKELFHELMLTKKQVATLLAKLEGSSSQVLSLAEVNLDTIGASATSSTTTINTEETTTTTETRTFSSSSSNTITNTTSEHTSMRAYGGSLSDLNAEAGMTDPTMSSFANFDTQHSLCAVLKLDQHEKASKQSGECLVSLSGLEARIQDRLKAFKTKTVAESMDYSTWREAGIACHQMRTCLNEVSRIISLAWITHLPPVSEQGVFSDPEVEKLRSDLAELQSKYSALETTLKDQQGKLSVSKQRQKDWENSVCHQLIRTSQDLEQAKENLDLSRGILQQVNTSSKANANSTDSDKPKSRRSLQLDS